MCLTVKQFCIYLRYVKRFEAYAQLRAFEAAAYPYMNQGERGRVMQRYTQGTSALISNPKDVEASWQILRSKYGDSRSRRRN